MLAKTVKVNIKVRRRKKVASGFIAISKQSLLFSLLFCTVQNTIHVSASGIPLSSASYKIIRQYTMKLKKLPSLL